MMLGLITSIDTRLTDIKTFFGNKAKALFEDKSGATAIEYGLIAAGIAIAIVAAVFALGEDITKFFTGVSDELKKKTPSTG